jgi:hypothetical protein
MDEWDDEDTSGQFYGPGRTLAKLDKVLSCRGEFKDNFDPEDFLNEHILPSVFVNDPARPKLSFKTAAHLVAAFGTSQKQKEATIPEEKVTIPWGPQAEGNVQTRETFEMYKYLKGMPECVRSMERGRKSTDNQEPLKDTIIFAMHHIDGKSLGGLCVVSSHVPETLCCVSFNFINHVAPFHPNK